MHTSLQISSLNNPDAPMIRTLTRKEAAEIIGVSQAKLDALTKAGKIRVCRVGRRRLFLPKFIEEFLNRAAESKF